jgi:hypothetical protein
MHSKIACDHNDHDHYADDVKDIHSFTPIEIPSVFNVLGCYSTIARDCDRGLSKSAHPAQSGERDEFANLLASLYAVIKSFPNFWPSPSQYALTADRCTEPWPETKKLLVK